MIVDDAIYGDDDDDVYDVYVDDNLVFHQIFTANNLNQYLDYEKKTTNEKLFILNAMCHPGMFMFNNVGRGRQK